MSELDRTNSTNTELVFAGADGEPFTTSLVIAAETGNQHQNVVELIRDNLGDLNEIGIVRFQTGKLSEGRGRPTTYAELDEPAAALLMTYLRNSPVVKDFKKRLVAGFYAMRKALAEQTAPAALPGPRELALMVIAAEDRADEAERQRIIEQKSREAAESYAKELEPKAQYVDDFVSTDDCILFRTMANQLDMPESELRDLLVKKKRIYRQFIGRRFSKKVGKLVDEYEWRAYADHKHHFRLFPQHNAPRHHNNQLRQTLYITPPGAQAIQKLVKAEVLIAREAAVAS